MPWTRSKRSPTVSLAMPASMAFAVSASALLEVNLFMLMKMLMGMLPRTLMLMRTFIACTMMHPAMPMAFAYIFTPLATSSTVHFF